MHIGLIGLGNTGNHMRARLGKNSIEVNKYNTNPAVSDGDLLVAGVSYGIRGFENGNGFLADGHAVESAV